MTDNENTDCPAPTYDPLTFCVTYDIVTPESAEDGDAAERGFCLPGGWRYAQQPDGSYPDEDLSAYDQQYGEGDIDDNDEDHHVARAVARAFAYDGWEVDCGQLILWGEHLGDRTQDDNQPGTLTCYAHSDDPRWPIVLELIQTGGRLKRTS